MRIRPTSGEYFDYFQKYVDLVPEGDIRQVLEQSLKTTTELFGSFSEDQGNYRYAPGKWSLKEVLGHVTDNERVMSYRTLRIARGDKTPLAGYDENAFISNSSFNELPLAAIVEDYVAVRRATLTLITGISDEAWTRIGIVNGKESSARAWVYILAGHELHHLNIIKERYSR
ncbi:MAG: DinB family protein [Cohnella sp.]|nr:DinB family protein [Cohnella sp.]